MEAGQVERPAERTLGQVREEYLAFKEQRGKRSVAEDKRMLDTRILPLSCRRASSRRRWSRSTSARGLRW